MLRLAVPNKGALAEPAQTMLREAGYRQRKDSKELVVVDRENSCELFFLRPRDIAVYVGEGTLDAGITGRDMLIDSGAPAEEVMPLGFGRSTFRFASTPGAFTSVADLSGRRIATSYAGLLGKYLADQGVDARIIKLDGAVETAIRLGVADAIADVVETGTTLRNVGLEVFGEPIAHSEAVLIKRAGVPETNGFEQLIRRLQGVRVAREYVMIDYDIRVERVEAAIKITPGMEGPTVSPLHREGWVAVRAMVPRKDHQQVMDRLYEIGARAILVTAIYACRL
ncbi:ATP phosphoribosyltransferase [Thermobispora bispora]|uniref:ATP phosphoribosyltransferase n=1 Tax=Thermobispora bispora (strain ATCC 19993 / DSM 43833 / CBS 139.67 / JCM 10125 / KCTC 9307 / NBRC 14880 / R51) TaxID=469371 RepID=D6Y1R9_THEBD|nr:ATP phosphoribosyltransferase [Thermobispora bispora]ADG88675.1 ATP phosphoribosyltransferase [Thermobispora bispora DSM 43833]MBO2474589.1 ATP phosphoribosyltransferase [Actinomycetales bacterium]MBX6169352.1 ATP phosphoribosyltransferase [Thermobispora bispora]QSI48458.1 ATP phosphoribosyltransferase [Thermobispora bispora]